MVSDLLARSLDRRGIHYGWVVAAITFLTMLITAGAMGAPGVFMLPLQHEFGWTAQEISAALAIRFALFGLLGPFAAAFLNRFGLRRVMLAALAIIVSALLLSLAMSEHWHLVLLWGIVLGFGTGLTAMVLAATVATRWFAARRGLVLGFLAASSATGQLAFLPLTAALTDAFGWRIALAVVCGGLGLATLAVIALMRDRPSDLGLPAYGETAVAVDPPATGSLLALLRSPLLILGDAARTWPFWILFGTFFVCGA
ncbi:MAG: MFS transporter, partial [Alphaproteobacteria bacterium]